MKRLLQLFDKKLWRFLMVGVVNTLVGSAIMFSLYNFFGVSYWASSCANYVLTSILSFFLNKIFTFEAKHWSFTMVAAFIGTIAVSYLMAYGVSKPLVAALLESQTREVRENVALFVGMCLFTGLNYLGQRFVVFSVKGKIQHEDNGAS